MNVKRAMSKNKVYLVIARTIEEAKVKMEELEVKDYTLWSDWADHVLGGNSEIFDVSSYGDLLRNQMLTDALSTRKREKNLPSLVMTLSEANMGQRDSRGTRPPERLFLCADVVWLQNEEDESFKKCKDISARLR